MENMRDIMVCSVLFIFSVDLYICNLKCELCVLLVCKMNFTRISKIDIYKCVCVRVCQLKCVWTEQDYHTSHYNMIPNEK